MFNSLFQELDKPPSIELRNIRFYYNSGEDVLKGINLAIPPYSYIAILGYYTQLPYCKKFVFFISVTHFLQAEGLSENYSGKYYFEINNSKGGESCMSIYIIFY